MSATWADPPSWLLQSALAGGLLLLVVWGVMQRHGQPARRHRLGLLGVTAALLAATLCLGPRWLVLPLDVFVLSAPPALAPTGAAPLPDLTYDVEAIDLQDEEPAPGLPAGIPQPSAAGPWTELTAVLPGGLVGLWAVGAVIFLGRFLLGHAVLARILRTGHAAPPRVARLFAAMVKDTRSTPRLLVSSRVRVPFSCGLFRPTVVLSPDLCDADDAILRWVFAHELTHLARRDAWTAFLFSLGQTVYFYLPWFWWLRRQVRLCQEYLADAAAARQPGSAEDYAQFLLTLTTKPAVPVGATGVTGNTSDLYRRVAMLLQTPGSVEKRCGWLWSLAATAGLLALAVFASGIGLRADAAEDTKTPVPALTELDIEVEANAAEDKDIVVIVTADGKVLKVVPDQQGARKEEKRIIVTTEPGKRGHWVVAQDGSGDKTKKGALPKVAFPDVEGIIKELPPGLSAEQLKQFREQMHKAREEMQRALEQVKQQLPKVAGSLQKDSDAVKKAMAELKKLMEKDLKGNVNKELQEALEKALQESHKALELKGLPKLAELHLRGVPGGTGGLAWVGAGQGRLGIRVEKPSDTLAEQLDLPKGQGLVITEVTADSAAAKAGLKANDILLTLDGKTVANDPAALVSMVAELKANAKVDAVVLRKGQRETVKGITVGETVRRRILQAVPGTPAQIEVKPRIRIQTVPPVPAAPAAPGLPAVPGARIRSQIAPGGKQVMMTVNRSNDNFTAVYQEDAVTVSVSGTMAGGRARATAIEVKDGAKTTKYTAVDKVPAEHRDKVTKLLEAVEKGGAKIDIKAPAAPPPPAPKKPAGRDVLEGTLEVPTTFTTGLQNFLLYRTTEPTPAPGAPEK